MKTNAPPLLAISMALRMRRGNAECISQWRRIRALVEASGYSPLGKYPLCIALAAARVTYKTTTIKKHTYFASHSDGHGNAPVSYCVHRSIEKVQRFDGSHWTPPSGKYSLQIYQSDIATLFFLFFYYGQLVQQGLGVMSRPLLTIGV
jgi:hypothetical protein